MNRILQDLLGVLILACFCTAILVVTFVGVMLGSYFASVVYRMGAHGSAAEWLAHGSAFVITVTVIVTVVDRVFSGEWFWNER